MERRCGCGGLGLGLGGFDGFVTSHKVLICNIFWVCFVAAIVWVQANVGRSRGRRGGRGRDFGGCSRDYDATGRAAAGGGSGYVQEGRGDLIAGGRGLAERGGFEPPVDFKGLRRFSKPLLSTTQPPLREEGLNLTDFRRGALIMDVLPPTKADCRLTSKRSGYWRELQSRICRGWGRCFVISRSPVRSRRVAPLLSNQINEIPQRHPAGSSLLGPNCAKTVPKPLPSKTPSLNPLRSRNLAFFLQRSALGLIEPVQSRLESPPCPLRMPQIEERPAPFSIPDPIA